MGSQRDGERKWGAKTADERRAQRRQQLIAAAIPLYDEKGFSNCSVKAVCQAAGLTERYFYESFANGEDLLKECFTIVTGELAAKVRTTAETIKGGTRKRVRAALLTYLVALKSNPPAARLFLLGMGGISTEIDALVSSNLDDFGRLLLQVLRRKAPPGGASDLLLRGVIGGGLYVARAWASDDFEEDIEHVADTALRIYMLVR